MHRRELLRATAAAAALTLLPGETQAAWRRAHTALASAPSDQPATDAATIAAVADAIIPRTDTPSATDVGVPAWIAVVVADYYTPAEHQAFNTGVAAINALALSKEQQPFAALSDAARARVMDALDAPADRTTDAARGYARLKGLVIHAYFTSERVQKDVLHTEIMPGRWDGNAPMPRAAGGRND